MVFYNLMSDLFIKNCFSKIALLLSKVFFKKKCSIIYLRKNCIAVEELLASIGDLNCQCSLTLQCVEESVK
jgi:hypothetical protein